MVAPCHYDGYHNVYAQLGTARKHFVLVPHTQQSAALLRPFPFVHPSHAQCQVDLTTLPSSTLVRLLLPAQSERTAARRAARRGAARPFAVGTDNGSVRSVDRCAL